MIIKACIFDLDGVITDTAHHHYLSWKNISDKIGFELTAELNENLKGVSRVESLEKILTWAGVSISNSQKTELLEEKNLQYIKSIEKLSSTDILPGVSELLTDLKKNDIRCGIGSSSKNAILILNKLHLFDVFDVISDGNSVKVTKPDPEVFLNAARKLGISNSNCVVFEDAPSGVEAAIRADMIVVGIGRSEDLPRAKVCLETMLGLTFEKLNQLLK